jgi:hypothetical protein
VTGVQTCALPISAKALRQGLIGEVPKVVPSSPHADASHCIAETSSSPADPVLAQIAANWADLPEAVKAGLLALVQAAGGER